MKVIFTKTNEIKDVSFGYAVNYLFPRSLAVPATEKVIERVRIKNQELRIKNKKEIQENKKLAGKFKNKEFKLAVKAGKKGKLYGAVTKKDLAEVLGVEKTAIVLKDQIKKIGDYKIGVKLGTEKTEIKLKVEAKENEKK